MIPSNHARPLTSERLSPATAFDFLLGTWSLGRDVSGHATAVGHVVVSPIPKCDHVALYLESVQVQTKQGASFHATQRYRVHRCPNGLELRFDFTDQLFERLIFTQGGEAGLAAEAEHTCRADHYHSRFIFGPGRHITITHVVAGPRKRYISHSVLSAWSPATDTGQTSAARAAQLQETDSQT